MTEHDLRIHIAAGEDSSRQFKADIHNAESLAAEMAAFANGEGGVIYIGVACDGSLSGLAPKDVTRCNQLISNAASQLVRSPLIVHTENVLLEDNRVVIVLTVPKGLDKPYLDKNGVIWLKTGADKRRINSKEELCRLFQMNGQFHADELPTKADVLALDKFRFKDFLSETYQLAYPESDAELMRLLQNMNLATEAGKLNLACVLLFAERPEWILPQFVIKAIRYPGNEIHITDYLDSEDFSGPMRTVFDNALAFIMRNLHKVQAGRSVNAPGLSEIPQDAIEELLVNALLHRDYFVSAPIRLFVFDNRIEIVSHGNLPNNLNVKKIKTGNSNIRNPILVSYAAKGLLPYHGLGSGIPRALRSWSHIEFLDDREGCLFKTIINRRPMSSWEVSASGTGMSGESVGETCPENMLGAHAKEHVGKHVGENAEKACPENMLGAHAKEHDGEHVGENAWKTHPENMLRAYVEEDDGEHVGENAGKAYPEDMLRAYAKEHDGEHVGEKILTILQSDPQHTIAQLAVDLGVTTRTVERAISALRKEGRLHREGSARSGRWEVLSALRVPMQAVTTKDLDP